MTFEEWWEVQEDLDRNPANEAFARPVWDAAVVNSKLIPEGYVLVPVEPTEPMLSAVNGNDLMSWDSEAIYKAMIQAAQEEE